MLPNWDASILQLPLATKIAVPFGSSEQTLGVLELRVTGRRELETADGTNDPSTRASTKAGSIKEMS